MKRKTTVHNMVEPVLETGGILVFCPPRDPFLRIWMVRAGSQYKSCVSNNRAPLIHWREAGCKHCRPASYAPVIIPSLYTLATLCSDGPILSAVHLLTRKLPSGGWCQSGC